MRSQDKHPPAVSNGVHVCVGVGGFGLCDVG